MPRVLLINPAGTEQAGFTNPPLNLLYLAGSLLQAGIDVRVVDECTGGSALKELVEYRPDYVGISCLTPARHRALDAAKQAKQVLDCKVILGGAHASIMYKQLLENYPFIDAVVIGEGEQSLAEICQGTPLSLIPGIAYKSNLEAVRTEKRNYIEDLDQIPFPAWHLIDLSKYPGTRNETFNNVSLREPRISVIFSRGCIGRCTFCSTWWLWRGYRRRSPKNMADELEFLYKKGVRHFCFADDALTVDTGAVKELCDEIIRRGLKIAWHATTRTDLVKPSLLKKMREAGCYEIAYGIETASPVLLSHMNKENTVTANEQAIQWTREAGIRATALLIVGSIGETEETIQTTRQFLRKTRPDSVGCVGGLWVLPGTELYRSLVKIGAIDDSFWLTQKPYMTYTGSATPREVKRWQNKVTNYSWQARIKNIVEAIKNKIG